MRHFFILTHYGIDVKFWNELLGRNKYLHSHFIYNDLNTYYNSNITFKNGEQKNILDRNFDILVANWQIGFKNTLDFSKIVHIWQDDYVSLKRLREEGTIHPNCCKNYLEHRKIFIKQILKRNKNCIHVNASHDKLISKVEWICDFAGVPMHLQEINQEAFHQSPYPL